MMRPPTTQEGNFTPRRDFDPATVTADGRRPAKLAITNWGDGVLPRARVEGQDLGTGVTVLFYSTAEIGAGPRLHVHPYDEMFMVVRGRARFWVGDDVLEAGPGEAVLGPRGLPHRFVNIGPGELETVDVHLSPRWIQTDLD
jgi:mannose-6-phosphate isomerase-like protein (cupin superfamily)